MIMVYAIKRGMTEHENPRHNLRLTPALKAKLGHSAIDNGRSMNAEILARLEQSFEPDPASRMVDALRPVASLTDADRKAAGRLLAELGDILARSKPRL